MRFMMIVKADEQSEAGVMPDEKLLSDMTTYNEELAKSGAMLDASGLQPSSKGARVVFSGGKPRVI
ncbi:MAG TPA: YciI family protein, partial [Candidatus Krumholzibacteria bacterium]|nr:YciI family protein [Candidatus Krumholzibacteria bacterium]